MLDIDIMVERQLTDMCLPSKCEVCVVPLGSSELANKHYTGKIHMKKVERWRENWKHQKRLKMENDSQCISYGGYMDDCSNERQDTNVTSSEKDQDSEKLSDDIPTIPDLSKPLDPRVIDSMDPSMMKKMLSGKLSSRWDSPKETSEEVDTTDETADDPDDTSLPIDSKKLMRKCFNPMTGIGYCQYCNKLLKSQNEASKHFSSAKHAGRVLSYQELLLSEAAILAGTAVAAPPPHRGHYCELCESDCSGQVQLDQHLRGERHRTNVRKMERELIGDPELDKDINPYNLPEVWLRDRKHCNLCDVPIFSIRIAKIHFNSRNHRFAAGLNLSKESREADYVSSGPNYCDVCDFSTESDLDMKVHTAGIRHIENERTKAAVESSGGEWKPSNPIPLDPPKFTVQNPASGNPPPMMAWGGSGWGWGGPMASNVFPPMQGYLGQGPGPSNPMEGSGYYEQHSPGEHIMGHAGGLSCRLCSVSFTSSQDLAQHETCPQHLRNQGLKMERDRLRQAGHNLPESDQEAEGEEEEDFLPEPLPENPSSVRTKANPFHCPFCKVWIPTVTLLKFYHRLFLLLIHFHWQPEGGSFYVLGTYFSKYFYFFVT